MQVSSRLSESDILSLKKGQYKMTLMFEEFDKICRKYNLKYWCIGGTLIGILRKDKINEHNEQVGGWISHDADIDISMLSEDYEIFKTKINELSKNIFVQDTKSDKKYHIKNMAKLRDINSHYLNYTPKNCHRGLQIDIFLWTINNDKLETTIGNQYRFDLYDTIFPLKEMYFEHILVFVPNNYQLYAQKKCGGWPIPYLPIEKRYPHEGLINPNSAHPLDLIMYPHLYQQ